MTIENVRSKFTDHDLSRMIFRGECILWWTNTPVYKKMLHFVGFFCAIVDRKSFDSSQIICNGDGLSRLFGVTDDPICLL